jgi:hypothetical protein
LPLNVAPSEPLDESRPFQIVDLVLPSPMKVTGVRLSGPAGGLDGFVTCSELDVISPPIPPRPANVEGRR